jgi:Sec-independent protein translocase protein TatA
VLGTIGLTAILLAVLLLVLLFGSSLIPKLFRAVGGLGRDYRRGKKDDPSDSG